MAAEISIHLDIRRIKKDGVSPLKLREYNGAKTEHYPTIYNMAEHEFQKLQAKRISEALTELADCKLPHTSAVEIRVIN